MGMWDTWLGWNWKTQWISGHLVLWEYSTGKAYWFYEQEICTCKKKYSLSDYFLALFNYCFPASFCMQQHVKFHACKQNDMSTIYYLHKLQDIADTIGDITEDDIVLAFFWRAQVYLYVKLVDAGYQPMDLTIVQLEDKIISLKQENEMKRRGPIMISLTMTPLRNQLAIKHHLQSKLASLLALVPTVPISLKKSRGQNHHSSVEKAWNMT